MEKVYPVTRNQRMELEVGKLAFGGKGLARVGEYIIFIEQTLPGDRVLAQVTRRKPNYAEAKLLTIIKPSPLRIESPCPYFGTCGGCTWQNLTYEDQVKFKLEHVRESLKQLAGLEEYTLHDPLPSPLIWGYRNKMEFSFSDRRWLMPEEMDKENLDRDYVLGLHVPGTYDKILNIDNCLLQSPTANGILRMVDDYCARNRLPVYGLKSHQGYLRFLVIRHSYYNGEIMVNLVTAEKKPEILLPLIQQLTAEFPQISSVINSINTRRAQIAFGDEEIVLYGKDHLLEQIHGLKFKISANSFFQTNPLQAQHLYDLILEYAGLNGSEVTWDMYSGTGTIAVILARQCRQVYGFELIPSAVRDAVRNTTEFGVHNVHYIAGDLLKNLNTVGGVPDVVVTDPPRSGMHQKVCEFLVNSGIKKIIYVSCNPATMARDVKLLNDQYTLIRVQPVDMFPHTYHIETVSELVKR
jgi:23S rRNA (uracil1939-C5)-methyltransferase